MLFYLVKIRKTSNTAVINLILKTLVVLNITVITIVVAVMERRLSSSEGGSRGGGGREGKGGGEGGERKIRGCYKEEKKKKKKERKRRDLNLGVEGDERGVVVSDLTHVVGDNINHHVNI